MVGVGDAVGIRVEVGIEVREGIGVLEGLGPPIPDGVGVAFGSEEPFVKVP